MTLPSSYRKANDHEDGPFRRVVAVTATRTKPGAHYASSAPRVLYHELLECGHHGRLLGWRLDTGPVWPFDAAPEGTPSWRRLRLHPAAKKRRCWPCRNPQPVDKAVRSG